MAPTEQVTAAVQGAMLEDIGNPEPAVETVPAVKIKLLRRKLLRKLLRR